MTPTGRVRFGAREWMGLAGLMLSSVAMAGGIQHYLIKLELRAAVLEHVNSGPHPPVPDALAGLAARIDANRAEIGNNRILFQKLATEGQLLEYRISALEDDE